MKIKGGIPVLNSRRKIAFLFIAVNGGIIILSIIYAIVFHFWPELFSCAFKETFHLYCPGCGGSRAVSRLLSFDIVGSFICFPPLYFAIGAIAELDIRMIAAIIKNDKDILARYRPTAFIIFAAVLIVHFVLRNALLLGLCIDPLGDIIQSAVLI